MSAENKSTYEIGFHLIPTLQEEEIANAVAQIRQAIASAEGSISKEEAPKFRRLAYEMRKKIDAKYETYDSAHFGYIIFDVESDGIAKIKEAVDLMTAVLRYLIVKDPVLERIEGMEEELDEEAEQAETDSNDSSDTHDAGDSDDSDDDDDDDDDGDDDDNGDDDDSDTEVSEEDLDKSLDKIVNSEEGDSSDEEVVK